jgi:hypothetical protein
MLRIHNSLKPYKLEIQINKLKNLFIYKLQQNKSTALFPSNMHKSGTIGHTPRSKLRGLSNNRI